MNWQNVAFTASYGKASQLPKGDLPEIAFAGRSNVGKSSLLNRLVQRKRIARVSSVPGKTATINFFTVENTLHLVDLPGYGYAQVSKAEKARWSELMDGYFSQDRPLALVVQLLDMRHPPTAQDEEMIRFLVDAEIPFLPVLTKADKLTNRQRSERLTLLLEELPYDFNPLPVSAQTGEGIEELRAILEDVL